jgi:hypothetical protein
MDMNVENILVNQDHPWAYTGQGGFDILHLSVHSKDDYDKLIEATHIKHWRVWISDSDSFRAILYRPGGQNEDWKETSNPNSPPEGGTYDDWISDDHSKLEGLKLYKERLISEIQI